MSEPTAKGYTKIIVGTCNHAQTYPFHNTTNGESGSYRVECGHKIPAKSAPGTLRCVGCEGKTEEENNPCKVCGKAAPDGEVVFGNSNVVINAPGSEDEAFERFLIQELDPTAVLTPREVYWVRRGWNARARLDAERGKL